jgi:hypothetical protein
MSVSVLLYDYSDFGEAVDGEYLPSVSPCQADGLIRRHETFLVGAAFQAGNGVTRDQPKAITRLATIVCPRVVLQACRLRDTPKLSITKLDGKSTPS